MSFVENVLSLLEERHMTNNELARLAGISSGGISKILRPSGNPSLRYMQSIADALDVPLATLIRNENDPPLLDGRPDDEALLMLYRQLSPEKKEYVRGFLEGLLEAQKE